MCGARVVLVPALGKSDSGRLSLSCFTFYSVPCKAVLVVTELVEVKHGVLNPKFSIKTSRQVGRKRKGVLIIPIRITIPAVTQTRKRDG
jgi:hypothetical protein